MNNKFKIKQISTDQYVLSRQQGAYTQYINYDLDVVVLDVISSSNNVVFDSLYAAQTVLQTYNSKQLLQDMRDNSSSPKQLSIKSVKFKYKVDSKGSEEVVGVDNES